MIFVNVSTPAAFSGKGSIIVLEFADADTAMNVARKIARETGRAVTVRDEEFHVIGAISATTVQ